MTDSQVPVDSLDPAPYNPRRISDAALQALSRSIARFTRTVAGEDGPPYRLQTTLTINKQGNRIIGGHQRARLVKHIRRVMEGG